MRSAALRLPLFLFAPAVLVPLSAAPPAVASPPARSAASAAHPPADELLSEIQTHFRATRKWFGMVSDLGLERATDGTITPHFETLHSKFVLKQDAAGQTLNTHLPPQADAAHVVEFNGLDGFSVRTKEVGIQSVAAEIHQGVIVYRGAVAGGELLYKLTPTHVDEYIYLRQPPSHLHREFEFDTGSAVWGLREADTMIEVLGKDGIARLRLSAPLARAADGKRRRGTAHVVGRKIILDIDLSGLAAPVLVDPDWSTTGTMTTSHWGDAAWRRPDGRVMAVGGCALTGCPASFIQTSCGQILAGSDIWDPPSGTWTSGPPMATARNTFVGIPLPSGDLVAAGGCTVTSCTQTNDAGTCLAQLCTQTTNLTERYSYATGAWVDAGSLASPRFALMGAPVGSGDALVAGGCDVGGCTTDVERWSAATGTWTAQAPLPAPRAFATATTLADGRILVVGGCADPICTTVLSDAALYDPVANTWTTAGSMSAPRAGHSATLLSDGTVLVAGGCMDSGCMNVLGSVDIWSASSPLSSSSTSSSSTVSGSSSAADGSGADDDADDDSSTGDEPDDESGAEGEPGVEGGSGAGAPSAPGGSFAPGPPMMVARHHHTANLLANGEVLMAGGLNAAGSSDPSSEVYLPLARQWIESGAMIMARAFHIGVGLSDGRVLVSGGCNPATCIPFAEVFSPANLPADSDAGVDAGAELMADGGAVAAVDAGAVPPPSSPHPRVYATGVVTCATDTMQDLPCPQPGWNLQDGDFQSNRQEFLQTAIDEITDLHTGLIWELNDDGSTYTQAQAVQKCANLTSSQASTGWRLPSVIELMTLIDNGIDLPSINPLFLGSESTNYWTSTPTAGANMLAWTVKFDFGEVIPLLMDTPNPVKCVRGASNVLNVGNVGLRKAGPFKTTALTVQDATTGLEWQREDDATRRDQMGGMDYCANLQLGGLSGWHLPNISELLSLVQYDAVNANGVAIDSAFQNPKPDLYWSSTQNEGIPTLSWSVTFNLGVVDGLSVTGLGFARCVRHMVPPPAPSSCGCRMPGAPGRAPAVLSVSLFAALAIFLRRLRRSSLGDLTVRLRRLVDRRQRKA